MPLTSTQRKIIQNILASISQIRLRMSEAGEVAVKLGITFRELERQSEQAYDELRALVAETKEVEKTLRKELKRHAGDRQ